MLYRTVQHFLQQLEAEHPVQPQAAPQARDTAPCTPPHPPQDPDTWSQHYARYVALYHELDMLHAHVIEPPMRRDVEQLLEATTGRLLLLHAWLTGQHLAPETQLRVSAATYQV